MILCLVELAVPDASRSLRRRAVAIHDIDAYEMACKAAEAIRALNHLTIRNGGYTWPSDVNAVVSELRQTVTRMGQALEQAGRWLEQAQAAGTIGHDQGDNLAVVGLEMVDRFGAAVSSAGRLAVALEEVQEITAHLTGINPPVIDFDL